MLETNEVFRVGDKVKVVDKELFTYGETGIVVMVLDKVFDGEGYTLVYVVVGNRWLPYESEQLELMFRPAFIPAECLKVLEKVKTEKDLRE